MKKDKALGRDPLGWIKATKEAESRQSGGVTKSEEQEASGLEAAHPEVKEPVETKAVKVEEIKESPRIEEPLKTPPEEPARIRREVSIEGMFKTPLQKDGGSSTYSTTKTNGSPIIFIIAYAVLLLILTFFVYFNLSKKIDDVNLRISNMEKSVNIGVKGRGTMQ